MHFSWYLCAIAISFGAHAAQKQDYDYFTDPCFGQVARYDDESNISMVQAYGDILLTKNEKDEIRCRSKFDGQIIRSTIIENTVANSLPISMTFLAGWMVTATDDNTIRFISADDYRGYVIPNKEIIHALTASTNPNNCYLFSGGNSSLVKLWDIKERTCVQEYKGHKSYVTFVQEGDSNNTIVSVSNDNVINTWDVETGSLKNSITHPSDILDMVIEGQTAYLVDQFGWIYTVNYAMDKKTTPLIDTRDIRRGIITTGQVLLVRSNKDNRIKYYDPRMNAYVGAFINSSDYVSDMAYDKATGTVYVAGDTSVTAWSPASSSRFKKKADEDKNEFAALYY